MQKNKLMRIVEQRENRGDIEKWLPAMVQELGFAETAQRLGIGQSTLKNWLPKMGWIMERRLVRIGGGSDEEGE